MARKITSKPTVAFGMEQACLGKIENNPYTNSMWTQYTNNEVVPN